MSAPEVHTQEEENIHLTYSLINGLKMDNFQEQVRLLKEMVLVLEKKVKEHDVMLTAVVATVEDLVENADTISADSDEYDDYHDFIDHAVEDDKYTKKANDMDDDNGANTWFDSARKVADARKHNSRMRF